MAPSTTDVQQRPSDISWAISFPGTHDTGSRSTGFCIHYPNTAPAPVVVTVFISCCSRDSIEHVWLYDVHP